MKRGDLKNVYNSFFQNFETLIDYFKDGIFFIKSKWVLKVILRIILDGHKKKNHPTLVLVLVHYGHVFMVYII